MNVIAKRKKLFFWALIGSIGFVVGIPMIIIGAGNNTFLMIAGIILVVFGFYGMPILWTQYGALGFKCSLQKMIKEDGIKNVSVLAASCGKDKKEVATAVRELISSRSLVGYVLIDDENILDVTTETDYVKRAAQTSGEISEVNCPNCGAKVELIGGVGQCEYCGYRFAKKTEKDLENNG